MPRQSPQFNAITCQHCGAVLILAPPGVWQHTTHIKCPHCQTKRTIRVGESERVQGEGMPNLIPV